jgi:hypothetical protein
MRIKNAGFWDILDRLSRDFCSISHTHVTYLIYLLVTHTLKGFKILWISNFRITMKFPTHTDIHLHFQTLFINITNLVLLMLPLQRTIGFSLLGDFLPFRPFVAQFSPPSYSHHLDIFLNVFNPSFPWSSSDSPTHWIPL